MPALLTCPLCRGDVHAGSSGCLSCHLSMADVAKHQPRSTPSRVARAIGVRLAGVLLYAAAVAWTALQMRDALVFVVPAAVLGGGLLHVWKGRPWWGLIVFTVVVVALPLVMTPALGAGFWTNLRQGF